MGDRRPTPSLKCQFTNLLHRAIINGEMPGADKVGPLTTTAIKRVAKEHPEASPLDVAQAYDAFEREHGASLIRSQQIPGR